MEQQYQQNLVGLSTYILPLPVCGLFAAFLWFKAAWLARRIASAASATGAPSFRGDSDIQRILLTMIGVLVLAFAIPEAARAIAASLLAAANPDAAAIRTSGIAGNWALLLQFLIGFSLLFGAPAISRFLEKLDSAETKALPQSIKR